MWDGGVLPPGGGVAAAAQEHVVGRRGRALGAQLALPPLLRHLGDLDGVGVDGGGVPVVVGVVLPQLRRENAKLPKGNKVLGVPLAALASAVQHLEDLGLAGVEGDVVEEGLDLVVGDGGVAAHLGVPGLK